MADKIKEACTAIGRYYKNLDAEYDDLFSNFCEENGFDETEVQEELNVPASDSQLVEFDEDFPFDKDMMNKDDAAKTQFIFDVINKCWKHPKTSYLYNIKMPAVDKSLFDITDQDIETIKQLYRKQCPVLWNSGMENDQVFLRVLAIGYKHNFDYLQHLVDDYFTGRVQNIEKSFTEEDWWKKHVHYRQLKKVKASGAAAVNEDDKKLPTEPHEIAVAAVKAFGARCCPKLLLSPMIEINDSLEITVKYIHSIVNFIRNLIDDDKFKDKAVCPFQVDLCIASGKPKDRDNKVNIDGGANPDGKSDDDDDESDLKFFDCIGDIKEKLDKNELNYILDKIEANVEQEIKARKFGEMFKSFIQKLGKSENSAEYPHNRRFIAFVDRRKKENGSADASWMYEPPDNCRKIPNDVVPEWYINASRTCLLPNMEYDAKEAEAGDNTSSNPNATKEQLINSNIGSSFHCKGALLTTSFICKESNAIKMYLYWNGQIIRLQPQDIKKVLINIFNMSWKNDLSSNAKFAESKEIDHLVEEIQQKVTDKYYTSFCNTYSM